ncbi:hypothetical protein AVEN_131956-1 [Araneus ventricosus]|uniref:Tc1-like transposase DDE domain-containing protein n=1 Tax=Araneus ventricosus TaxID=182803 RepID=A0A4Y2B1J1_ARAVE|nr:hypothetical protein AVEN_131956-1 [Araneus ventricosus]
MGGVCHPAYSPDLATSDFHLFPELKNWPGGYVLQRGIENLVLRYDKCLNLTAIMSKTYVYISAYNLQIEIELVAQHAASDAITNLEKNE